MDILKNKQVLIASLIVVAGLLFFLFKGDGSVKAFAEAYERSTELNSNFVVVVFVTNYEENPIYADFDASYKGVIDSLTNNTSNRNRLSFAQSGIDLLEELKQQLDLTDDEETDASKALLELNTKAASIKDDSLREAALKIADLSQDYFDAVRKYKSTLYDKRSIQIESLETIVDDNGGTRRFSLFLVNKNNQEKITKINKELDGADFVLPEQNLTQSFARFKGLAGL